MDRKKNSSMDWWFDAKFGLFIHFGLYSSLAGEYNGQQTDNIAEWIMNSLHIPRQEYEKLALNFDPKDFDADFICRLAYEAGMKYVVFTSKHHEGFAMFRSAHPYNIVTGSPFGRDPAEELRQACDKYGLKLCFYYSQAQDWHDPDGIEEGVSDEGKDYEAYLQRKCLPQLREILTQYGEIGLIWFDTPMTCTKEQAEMLYNYVKSIQPDCIVSGRVGFGLGDYMTTGDNFIPLLPYPGYFEVPATINGTWGYSKFDKNWKSTGKLLRNLVKIVSRGGNYLLNIGPDSTGKVPEKSVAALREIGSFMQKNGESIYGAVPLPVYPYDIDWGYLTAKPYKLYIHVFEEIPDVYLLNIANRPLRATLLSTGEELTLVTRTTCEGDSSWRILWNGEKPADVDCVICVEVEEETIMFEPIRA